MNNILCLIACLMVSILVRGQEYVPLLEENKVWSVSHEKHTLVGDTIISGINYKKLFFHHYLEEFTPDSLQYIAAMREDTINKKVYFIWKDHTEEVLLYDFSLQVGDQFQVFSPWFNLYGPDFSGINYFSRKIEVFQVSDTIVEGKSRRVLKVNHPDDQDSFFAEYWIEGIGSSVGLLYAGYTSDVIMDKEYPFLLCVHNNDQLVYKMESDLWGYPIDNCYNLPSVDVGKLRERSFDISIIPSLFEEEMNFVCNQPVQNITIYNLAGKIVYSYHAPEPFTRKSIPASHWASGVYIVRAGDGYGFASKKIVKM